MNAFADAAVETTTPMVRRRRYLLLRVADEPVFDAQAFLRGRISVALTTRCTLLCPVKGLSLPLTGKELDLAMTLPLESWASISEIVHTEEEHAVVLDLIRRGVILSKSPPYQWRDLQSGEEALQKANWHDLSAVFHMHTGWRKSSDPKPPADHSIDTRQLRLDKLHHQKGDPPGHFVERKDALARVPLNLPVHRSDYFDTLARRCTSRAFRADQPLPKEMMETMLFSVFGTMGIKDFGGISSIKRSSPSGGSLHPIEAYVLVIHVEAVESGIYHYETASHRLALLESLEPGACRSLATDFMAGQTYFSEAHVLFIHVARFDRNFWKYSDHRKAYKAIMMDAGHLSQTCYLTATHLGLGSFFTGAINDLDIAERLRLNSTTEAAIGINGVGLIDSDRTELDFLPDRYFPVSPANDRG